MKWQAMCTAPKDGTLILAYDACGRAVLPGPWPTVCAWRRTEHYLNGKPSGRVTEGWATDPCSYVSDEFNAYFKPTHWAPIDLPK